MPGTSWGIPVRPGTTGAYIYIYIYIGAKRRKPANEGRTHLPAMLREYRSDGQMGSHGAKELNIGRFTPREIVPILAE